MDKIGYRFSMLAAHVFCAAGLLLMTFLPDLLPSPFIGLILAIVWAAVPILNFFLFLHAPIAEPDNGRESGLSIQKLVRLKIFWILMLLMLCAGSCEQAVSQWASTFAEKGLGISKAAGDLAGPMLFAILMGTSRLIYGKWGEKLNLDKFMRFSGILCLLSYLVISLSPYPVLGLLGCGLCGLSVGILWPGAFSMAAANIHGGGTAMFALLALAGDLGCMSGPTFVGLISGAFHDNLKIGILAAIIFPLLLLAGLFAKNAVSKMQESEKGNDRLP